MEPRELRLQQQILRSLGFPFVEEPIPAALAPESRPSARPSATTPARRAAEAPAAAPASKAAAPPTAPDAPPPVAAARREFSPAERDAAVAELAAIAAQANGCTACARHRARRCAIAGTGEPGADLLVVLEAPTPEDNAAGELLSGEAGVLPSKMLAAMKLGPGRVFVTVAAKCGAPVERPAVDEEVDACRDYLLRQVAAVAPRAILCLGQAGMHALVPATRGRPWSAARGRWLDANGIPLLATHAPAHIGSDTARKRVAWADMQAVMAILALGEHQQ